MEPGALKLILSALVMPLASLVLVAVAGLVGAAQHKRTGLLLSAAASIGLWLLSCQAVSVWLARNAQPQYPVVTAAQLKTSQVQAIVVLGGGIYPQAPEYGQAQLSPTTAARLRYGVWLARQTGLPVAFSGGVGLAGADDGVNSEASVASRTARQDYNFSLKWIENKSRNTAENAQLLATLLKKDGITRIALVTTASHMPRSILQLERQGFAITPAPTGFVLPDQPPWLQWLPSTDGIKESTRVLHEVLGLAVAKLQ